MSDMQRLFGRLMACLGTVLVATSAAQESFLSPLSLLPDKEGHNLWVAEYTANQIVLFDIAGAKVTKTVPIPAPPAGMALSADGSKLYVSSSCPEGKLLIVDTAGGKVNGEVAVGHTPTAVVASPDGKTLFVCNRFNNDISVIDVATAKEAGRISVAREPLAAVITPDGKFLIVANHLPAMPADGDYVACTISVIDTATRKVASSIPLPNGSSSLRGICVSPDGKFAYVTQILARYQLPTTQLERGWMNTNALSIIDVEGKKLFNTVLLDDVDLGAANPWGVTCSPDGKLICVTHAGTHEVSVIDRAALHQKLEKIAKGEKVTEASSSADDVPNDLSFLVGIRRRLKLSGNGPRGLALLGAKVYAAEYFTDSIGVVDINPDNRPNARSLPLGPSKPVTVVRKGEMFFNDADLCFQHWQSCASCHPDSRADGLNWDLLNDGIGNPKNTKSMLLAHQTPPAMISGIRDSAEMAVRAGIRSIQFAVRPEEDAVAIDEYLKSLKPVPSPYLVAGKLSPAAERGKVLFTKAGCATCHTPPLYTNLKEYDIGTGKGMEKDKKLDTATLIECWRTAPYLYDGRAATMKDVLTRFNSGDKHGATSGLNEGQTNDLAEFVLSQ